MASQIIDVVFISLTVKKTEDFFFAVVVPKMCRKMYSATRGQAVQLFVSFEALVWWLACG